MTSVEVLIPYAGDDPHRAAALAYVVAHLDAHGWPVKVCRTSGPWSKGKAVNGALRDSTADVVVVHDADSFAAHEALTAAVDACQAWAVPHSQVRRLTPEATADVIGGAEPAKSTPTAEPNRHAMDGGGIVIARREVWADVGGFDARFAGWGGEDQSLGLALSALHGTPWRGTAILWHLWHPPAEHYRQGTRDNLRLLRRYQAARRRPDTLLRLIEEARHA